MKTSSHLRMYIIAAMMTATACSEPEVIPTTKPPVAPGSQSSNREYYAAVTTWSQDGNNFVGLVSAVPTFDLNKATISVVGNGKKTRIDPFFDSSKMTLALDANEGYIWASVQNNILLMNYVGPTTTSVPPFPLDVIIVY